MPVKFKKSAKEYSRATGLTKTTHYYIKGISKKELFEALNNHNTKPKIKQKIRNELTRRGITIVWREPTSET